LATTVYTTEEIALEDGTECVLKPLNIKALRLFMAKMKEFQDIEDDDEGLDILIDAAAICLKKQHPKFWDAKKHHNEEDNTFKGGFSEEFEEAVDMQTVYRILDICGGVKLDDPNLIAAAAENLGTN
jgi:hypothetical protein